MCNDSCTERLHTAGVVIGDEEHSAFVCAHPIVYRFLFYAGVAAAAWASALELTLLRTCVLLLSAPRAPVLDVSVLVNAEGGGESAAALSAACDATNSAVAHAWDDAVASAEASALAPSAEAPSPLRTDASRGKEAG